jgi:hypothetical protein
MDPRAYLHGLIRRRAINADNKIVEDPANSFLAWLAGQGKLSQFAKSISHYTKIDVAAAELYLESHWPLLDGNERSEVVRVIINVETSPLYKHDPDLYLKRWRSRLRSSGGDRFPDNAALAYFEHLQKTKDAGN